MIPKQNGNMFHFENVKSKIWFRVLFYKLLDLVSFLCLVVWWLFCCVNHDQFDINHAVSVINAIDPCILFTLEKRNWQLSFLLGCPESHSSENSSTIKDREAFCCDSSYTPCYKMVAFKTFIYHAVNFCLSPELTFVYLLNLIILRLWLLIRIILPKLMTIFYKFIRLIISKNVCSKTEIIATIGLPFFPLALVSKLLIY